MRTWNEYKDFVKAQGPEDKANMEQLEELSGIIGAVVMRREELGLSQRELAAQCGITQSALARLESCRTTPQIDTMLKVMRPLGLTLTVTPSSTQSRPNP